MSSPSGGPPPPPPLTPALEVLQPRSLVPTFIHLRYSRASSIDQSRERIKLWRKGKQSDRRERRGGEGEKEKEKCRDGKGRERDEGKGIGRKFRKRRK